MRRHRRPAKRLQPIVNAAVETMIEPMERRLLFSRLLGLDVSEFQGTINWTSVHNAGKTFAFIRATYGSTSDDAKIGVNASNSITAGMIVGFYHYAYYD